MCNHIHLTLKYSTGHVLFDTILFPFGSAQHDLRQYTVDGHCRPTFQQMVFLQDDMVDFPDIGHGGQKSYG